MSEQPKSVYRLGAEDGLVLGPLMAVMAVLTGASIYVPWLSLPAMACIVFVPVIAFMRLLIPYRNASIKPSFSAIWLRGICMFFFGGLIMSVVVFVCLRWIDPGFINRMLDYIINFYSSMGDSQASTVANSFREFKDSGLRLSPLDVALEFLYMAVFSGSIFSLFAALIIRMVSRRKNQN